MLIGVNYLSCSLFQVFLMFAAGFFEPLYQAISKPLWVLQVTVC